MHDVLNEEIAGQYVERNVTEISDEKIIDHMIESQTQALEYLRPSAKIIRQTEQEVNSVFNYLNNYRNVSKGYFIKVVGQVTKMYLCVTQAERLRQSLQRDRAGHRQAQCQVQQEPDHRTRRQDAPADEANQEQTRERRHPPQRSQVQDRQPQEQAQRRRRLRQDLRVARQNPTRQPSTCSSPRNSDSNWLPNTTTPASCPLWSRSFSLEKLAVSRRLSSEA